MSDPFANVDAVWPDIIEIIVAGLETRAADPTMLPVIDAYLDRLDPPEGGQIIDIGCGTGGVTRRIADRFMSAAVLGVEPSVALTDKARAVAFTAAMAGFMAPFRKADGSIGFGTRARYLVATPA